jgi:hypothetical protein
MAFRSNEEFLHAVASLVAKLEQRGHANADRGRSDERGSRCSRTSLRRRTPRRAIAPAAERRYRGPDVDDSDFEGTLVLEQLAEIGEAEEFFDAIDADDEARATQLMKRANVDAATIAIVIRKMRESDDEH